LTGPDESLALFLSRQPRLRRRVFVLEFHTFTGEIDEDVMQIEERSAGDVILLDLKGKMTLGEGDEILKDKINSLILQGRKKLVLNLADVPYIDSAGLGEIVRTYTTVSRQGGSLKLMNLTKRITDLLSITKLLTVFETYDSEADAVRSFQPSANV
jgi:anti-sigma B factor antagonist